MKQYPTQEKLKELFNYDGINLIWKVKLSRNNKGCIGDVAGCINKAYGYLRVRINKQDYYIHRLIWVWYYGDISKDLEIDHINGIRNDNRVKNLRLVTRSENLFNQRNVKGYIWVKSLNKWKVRITIKGKQKYLGVFSDEKVASEVYLKAKKQLHIIKELT